jgi:pimeloyl-ACP methyl ester carboxylesterase
VVAFERSGHGHTADTDKPFSYQDMADQTVTFIDALGLGPCHLLGWSDGAAVALLVALSRPDLTRSLVYISMNFDQSGVTPRVRRWIETLTAESFRRDEPMLAKRFDEASPDGPGHFAVVLEKTKRMWLNEPNIRREELARISVPTLIMAADKDAITIEHITEIARAIRGAQLSVIPGATHFLLSEKPELVNMVILGFLDASEL